MRCEPDLIVLLGDYIAGMRLVPDWVACLGMGLGSVGR